MSCLVRNFPRGEREFVLEGDGLYIICRGLQEVDARIRTKSLMLLGFLITADEALREAPVLQHYLDKVQETGAVRVVSEMIGDEHVDLAEGCLQVLLKLSASEVCRTELQALGVPGKVQEMLGHLGGLQGDELADAQTEIDSLQALATALDKGFFA